MTGKAEQQEQEALSHNASKVRDKNLISISVQLHSSFLFSPEPQPVGIVLPTMKVGIPISIM